MKKYIIFLLFIISIALQAQDKNSRPGVEEMHTRKWEFVSEKSNLSALQSARIQPVFMEYENGVWRLLEQHKGAFGSHNSKGKDVRNINYKEANDRYVYIEMQKAVLLKNYYSKLKKELSDEMIFNYFNAERSYRKELIKDWQRKRNQGK